MAVLVSEKANRRAVQRFYRVKVTAWTVGIVAVVALIASAIW